MEEISQRIILKAKKGKLKEFGQIVNYYHQKVFHVSFLMTGDTHEAVTLTEKIFVDVYLRIKHYDSDKKFSLWLYQLVTDQIMDYLKIHPQAQGNTDRRFFNIATSDNFQKNLIALPVQHQLIIILRYVIKLPLTEVSNILNTSLPMVRTYSMEGLEYIGGKFSPEIVVNRPDRRDA